jgi:hypothetical protein
MSYAIGIFSFGVNVTFARPFVLMRTRNIRNMTASVPSLLLFLLP